MTHRLAPIALALWMAAALAAGPAQAQSTTSDSTSAESMLIVTRVDTRKCAYPQCGGYFVKAVNVARTRCADGTLQKECHAVQLNTLALGWSPEQQAAFEAQLAAGKAMVKGKLEPAPAGFYTAEQLTVSQAWQGQGTRKALGTWYSAFNTGIVCITSPCPSFGVTPLNAPAGTPTLNPDLDLASLTGASQAAVHATRPARRDRRRTAASA